MTPPNQDLMDNIYAILGYACVLTPIIPIVLGLIRIKKIDKSIKAILVILFFSTTSELLRMYLQLYVLDEDALYYFADIKNTVFASVELYIYLLIFKWYLNNFINQYYLFGAAILYLLTLIICLLKIDNIAVVFSYVSTLAAVILISFSITVFYKHFTELKISLLKSSEFWINSSILFRSGAIFFFFIFNSYVTNEFAAIMYIIVSISLIVSYSIISYAICLPKTIQK